MKQHKSLITPTNTEPMILRYACAQICHFMHIKTIIKKHHHIFQTHNTQVLDACDWGIIMCILRTPHVHAPISVNDTFVIIWCTTVRDWVRAKKEVLDTKCAYYLLLFLVCCRERSNRRVHCWLHIYEVINCSVAIELFWVQPKLYVQTYNISFWLCTLRSTHILS